MDMEVDEGSTAPAPAAEKTSVNRNAIFVFYLMKKGGLKKSKMPVNSFDELTLEGLKLNVAEELGKWEWTDGNDKPEKFDILHRSRAMASDEDVKRLGPLGAITVISKDRQNGNNSEDHRSEKFIADYIKSRNIMEQLGSCSMALRTAFLNAKFVPMVENLGNSEMLENIFAIVPELKNDPVGIGIIQDPSLIFHLSDPESLRKLAKTKPWVIEAFNFISASIHQEQGGGPPQGIPPHMFNNAFIDGDDESMEDDDEDSDSAGNPQGQGGGARITREQVAAALSALGGGGGMLPRSNAFGGLFQPPRPSQQQAPTSASSNTNPAVARAGANIQNLMNTLAGGSGTHGQPLNSDLVARAVTDALRRLTPEQREDQINAIRNMATQLHQGQTGGGTQSQPNQVTPQAPAAPPQQRQDVSGSSSLAQQYESQLKQMRDMGITDQRLSILALRVSEGDVNTAVELIFSGWQGEGSDAMN